MKRIKTSDWVAAVMRAEDAAIKKKRPVERIPVERDGHIIISDTRVWDLQPEPDYPQRVAAWRGEA